MTVHDQKHVVYEWAFVIDTTGSMGGELKLLLDSLGGCVSRLQRMQVDLRVAVVAYREYGETGHRFADGIVDVVDFGPPDRVKQALGRLCAIGGGDRPEPAERALEVATGLGWTRLDANGERRRPDGASVQCGVVLITDAPPHGLGDDEDDWPQVKTDFVAQVDVLRNMGVPCHTLGVREFQRSNVAPGAYQLAALRTNGRLVRMESLFHNITSNAEKPERLIKFFCHTILVEFAMQDIMDKLQGMQLPDKSPEVVNDMAQSMLEQRMVELNIKTHEGDVCYRSLGGYADEDFADVTDAPTFSRRIAEKNVKPLPSAEPADEGRAHFVDVEDRAHFEDSEDRARFTSLPDAPGEGDDPACYRSAKSDEGAGSAEPGYRALAAQYEEGEPMAPPKKPRTEPRIVLPTEPHTDSATDSSFIKHTHEDRMKARVARAFA